jgi:flavin reductase (DIM6/NTAB) family NADH-FMN oxidoreductase RutF
MQFDMRALPPGKRYKILTSTVFPRPIAWVVTQSDEGLVNAAPHSFFNALGDDPAMVVLGLLKHHVRGDDKDSAANIKTNGEFVISLVREADVAAMNLTAVDCPRSVSELAYAGIETLPSLAIKPPRIATSPVSFECKLLQIVEIGTRQTVVLGEILQAHIDDAFILDAERLHIDSPAMQLIGRTHGSGWYARTRDQFQVDRLGFDPARVGGDAGSG